MRTIEFEYNDKLYSLSTRKDVMEIIEADGKREFIRNYDVPKEVIDNVLLEVEQLKQLH